MTGMAISSNSLGLKNPHQRFAYSYLALGGMMALLVLIRFICSYWNPLGPWEWLSALVLILYAGLQLYVGLRLSLAVFVDNAGPGPLKDQPRTLEELLSHRRILTYQRPVGLIALLLHRFHPELTYLTPPYQALRDGTWQQLIEVALGVAALLLMPVVGMASLPVLVIAAVALAVRVSAINAAVGRFADFQPPVDVYQGKEHLTEAGNPIDLYHHLLDFLDQFRERGFQNRLLVEQPPDIGANAVLNRFEASVVIETQPVPLEDQHDPARAVLLLDCGGVALLCVGVALWLSVLATDFNGWSTILRLAACFVSVEAGSKFRVLARALACTFRFRSDLLLVQLNGSYMVNEVAVGASVNSFVSTKGQAFKSDIIGAVAATRIISECGFPMGRLWDRFWPSLRLAEQVLEHHPRYLLSAQLDADFRDRLGHMLGYLRTYRDQSDRLRTPELGTEKVAQLMAQNLSMAQLMESATARGAALGQQQALQLMGGEAGTPASYITAQPLFVSPSVPDSRTAETARPPAEPVDLATQPTGSDAQASGKAAAELVRWSCSNCGHRLKAKVHLTGKTVRCSHCQTPVVVPSP